MIARHGLHDLLSRIRNPRVAGLMAGRIGPAYSRARRATSASADPDRPDIRAYPVPGLHGVRLVAPSEADLPRALETLLRDRVCSFDWLVEDDLTGPLRKYGLLHHSLRAPNDERRSQPMWLEVAGDVTSIAGVAVGRWLDVRPMGSTEQLDTEVPGPIEIVIDVATYSDTRFPGVGVPFYM